VSIKSRIDKLTLAAGRDNRASAAPPYDVTALQRMTVEELLRRHRAALADTDVPGHRLVAELRKLPADQLIRQHREALGYAGTAG
jgi:hypothetical protein